MFLREVRDRQATVDGLSTGVQGPAAGVTAAGIMERGSPGSFSWSQGPVQVHCRKLPSFLHSSNVPLNRFADYIQSNFFTPCCSQEQ